MMKYLYLILLLFSCISFTSNATWIDFEELQRGKVFSYKAYLYDNFQIKASKYFGKGTVTYYGFLLQANLGDSNEGENYLAVDSGSYYFLPGISIEHKKSALFDLNYIEIGKLYAHDGYFHVRLTALDAQGNIISEQLVEINYGLATVNFNNQFKKISQLLVNAVFVDELQDSVARFAIDNIDVTISE
ncbi:MAG: hypothetical protein GY787_03105 [Alteromonadales bacterium]|nr:hypothetical protein [Alteromonadales bacterium]